MNKKQVKTFFVLYCGDDSLKQSARYLHGVLDYLGFKITYFPSCRQLKSRDLRKEYSLIIMSDYPSKMISKEAEELIPLLIAQGTGFLMIGGWGSFHGYDGNYQQTKLGKVLPVQCLSGDDRVNCTQGAVIIPGYRDSSLAKGLQFARGPLIGGYNKVQPKKGSRVLLNIRDLRIDLPKLRLANKEYPLLVTGNYGLGCTAAYMSDLAPHWSGGLVDWGKKKIKIKNVSGQFMEVGQQYVLFIKSLIELVLGEEKK